MVKGTKVVRYISGKFEERRWGVDQFDWVKDGKPGSDHAPTKDILDMLGYMEPLTPTVDPLTEVMVVGGYNIKDGIISKEKRDLTQEEVDNASALSARIAEDAANLAALKAYQDTLHDMLYWDGLTDEAIDTLVNTNMSGTTGEIITGIKLMIKKLAKAQRDNVSMFRMLYEAGIIPGKHDL